MKGIFMRTEDDFTTTEFMSEGLNISISFDKDYDVVLAPGDLVSFVPGGADSREVVGIVDEVWNGSFSVDDVSTDETTLHYFGGVFGLKKLSSASENLSNDEVFLLSSLVDPGSETDEEISRNGFHGEN